MVQSVGVVSNKVNNPLNSVHSKNYANFDALTNDYGKFNDIRNANSKYEIQTKIADKFFDDVIVVGISSGILLDILKVKRPALKGFLAGIIYSIAAFLLYCVPREYVKAAQNNKAKKRF